MTTVEWHTLLASQLSMSPAVAAELGRQLAGQARALAGVKLDDGHHAFAPSDQEFTVQYRNVGGVTIASVEGDLIGPDAEAHPAVLAWRSIAGADPRLTPERDLADLEFFWMEFPTAELAYPHRVGTRDWAARNRFGFGVDFDLHTLPGISLQLSARSSFTSEQVAVITAAVDGAIDAWNRHASTRVHYRGEAVVSDDHRVIAMYVDLGTGDLDALTEIFRAIDTSSAGAAVSRCRVAT
jgi:hypothetical protein